MSSHPAEAGFAPGIACYLLSLDRLTDAAPAFSVDTFGPPEQAGTLAIHRATLDPARHEAAARNILPSGDRSRIETMREPALRRARLLAHAGLRLVLAQRLGIPPRTIAFTAGPFGKPLLRDHPGTHVSIAWRADIAAFAVAAGRPVGIDVEIAPGQPDMDTVARWLFSSGEVASLDAAIPEHRPALFLAAWTRKEALCKAAGVTLDRMRGHDTRQASLTLADSEGSRGSYAVMSFAGQTPAWSVAWRENDQAF